MSQPGGAGTAAVVDGSGFVHIAGTETVTGDKTFSGATTLGNTSLSSGKTLSAGAGTTTGTAVDVSTGNSLGTGTALNVDTGTSAFSGSAVKIQSTGNFTGTLLDLGANNTTAGTVLGISANALTTGAVMNATIGGVYTGPGAIRLTANAASTGSLLAINSTSLAGNGGNAVNISLGVPGGAAEPAEGKAVRVALGSVGDAYYANADAAFAGNYLRFQAAGADVLTVSRTAITTTASFSQTGAATFSTGTGAVSLNGNTTIASGMNFAQLGAGTFSTGTGAVSLNGNTTIASGMNFAQLGAGTFSTGTGNISLNGNIVTNVTQTGATSLSTGTGAVSLNGDTTVADGRTLTVGSASNTLTTQNAAAINTGNGLSSGSALAINTGTSAFTGSAVNIQSSGAFAGQLMRLQSTAAFGGTLLQLLGNNTTAGTVLGVSGTSLSTGRAIDVTLAAQYTGTGAVNVSAGAFGVTAGSGGTVFNVTSSSNAQNATANLAQLQGALTQGRLLYMNTTAAYAGTGAMTLELGGTGGAGTGALIAANSTYSGRFLDLTRGGTSLLAIDPTNGLVTSLQIQTSGNFTQTGATTFSTGTGAISLNGPVTLAANQTFVAAAGTGSLDFSATTGTFQTGTGAVSLNGNVTIASGRTLTFGTGTPIAGHLSATASLDIAGMDASCVDTTMTVTGAAVGDTVIATPTPTTNGIETFGSIWWFAYVSSASTVTIRSCELTGTGPADNPALQTWRADVWKH